MAEDIFGVDCDFGVFAEDDDEEVKFPNFKKIYIYIFVKKIL